jgi:hypothetical protein
VTERRVWIMSESDPALPDEEALSALLAASPHTGYNQEYPASSVPERIRQFHQLLGDLPIESTGAFLLYREPGADATRCVPLGQTLVVGRTPKNERNPAGSDLAFDDHAMSRTHFQIECADGLYVLRDLESHNGTYLNNEPEPISVVVLKAGDIILAGNVVFAFTGE